MSINLAITELQHRSNRWQMNIFQLNLVAWEGQDRILY